MSVVSVVCCQGDELITRPEESYRLCCVVVCDLETSRMGAPYIYNVRLLRVNMGLKGRRFAGRTQSDQDNVLTSAGNKLPVPYKAEMSCVWERLLASE